MQTLDLRRFAQTAARGYVRHAPGALGKSALVRDFLNESLREHPVEARAETVFGADFDLNTEDLIQRYIYAFGIWEPNLSRWLRGRLSSGDTFVDVGSNIGYFSVLGSRLVGPAGHVVAIEASPEFHAIVLRHLELNSCQNVRAVNAAVSDRQERLKFILASRRNMGANSIVPWDGEVDSVCEVDAFPLPELLTPDELAAARVIKIDVEGAEGAVFKGLAPSLGSLREDVEIAMEVTPQRMEQLGYSADEMLAVLRDHGFNLYRLENSYKPESYPAALVRPAEPPRRLRGSIGAENDLIFSRVDAETL